VNEKTDQIKLNINIIKKIVELSLDIKELQDTMKFSRLPSMVHYRNMLGIQIENISTWINQIKVSMNQIFTIQTEDEIKKFDTELNIRWPVSKIISEEHKKCYTDWEECILVDNDEVEKLQRKIKGFTENLIQEDNTKEFSDCFQDMCFNILCSQQSLIDDEISDEVIDFVTYSIHSVMTCGDLTKSNIDWNKVEKESK
jgi:hypothetical protein